jgi:phosphoribosylformylglycinamidine synthase
MEEREILLRTKEGLHKLDIDVYRDHWFSTSHLLDREQTLPKLADERKDSYASHPLDLDFGAFTGSFKSLGVDPDRRHESGVKAAIIREKGVNGDREMAHALYLAGFDVKDVHMTDLITGRETLEDIQMIVFVGGFSNSDVLGSAKGWAGAFKYNEKARIALEKFYARKDTLSLGICNGCQLMIELNLVVPEHAESPTMLHNASGKFESAFLGLHIPKNHSVMLGSLEGMKLGVWVAHGEGKFSLPLAEAEYHIAASFSHSSYPANPNGSDYDVAALCSADGRHLAMMPHLERAYLPWQCAYYPDPRKQDEATPWLEAFVNARRWCESQTQ